MAIAAPSISESLLYVICLSTDHLRCGLPLALIIQPSCSSISQLLLASCSSLDEPACSSFRVGRRFTGWQVLVLVLPQDLSHLVRCFRLWRIRGANMLRHAPLPLQPLTLLAETLNWTILVATMMGIRVSVEPLSCHASNTVERRPIYVSRLRLLQHRKSVQRTRVLQRCEHRRQL